MVQRYSGTAVQRYSGTAIKYNTIPEELMRVLLSSVREVLANHLELLVDLDGLHHVAVGRAAQGGRHQADGAGKLACRFTLVQCPCPSLKHNASR